ncbi:ImmA/IrrE family metallo-endopeptidase [Brevibacterium sp. 91QC2O2]|uniref:ImmA/IrrE family metallo-endopeptidase n=1 Tax=Brevibacterium TaxID=1696 RepID=UPI00211BC3F5|nr:MULTISPECIES: ImmA/IrrE family metallo-endopeptidase [unclassified Brevibacterium]MCQ9367385.1 ImmA/IrrE family metallo-endopeptidase [Brevibacterium sp. 91QC2O2]MCQ9384602.1 ImmA/IrrE family metallo-endopeptidase [Brevibacterium sp. 68QC2CO]
MRPYPHPWADLLAREHVVVSWHGDLPPGMRGATNGIDIILLSTRLRLQPERRCTLTHELVHVDWGHTCGQSPAIESRVRRETARRLILPEHLEDAARWASSTAEAAEALWVTEDVLIDRLHCLTTSERDALISVCRGHWQQP